MKHERVLRLTLELTCCERVASKQDEEGNHEMNAMKSVGVNELLTCGLLSSLIEALALLTKRFAPVPCRRYSGPMLLPVLHTELLWCMTACLSAGASLFT